MTYLQMNGEPYFVGKDVATILGYSNPRDALAKHVDDEDKGVAKCDTLGGIQDLTVINESGLYSLILSSKLESAKQFKRWITHEVIPSIRKTGGYVSKNHKRTPNERRENALLGGISLTSEQLAQLIQQGGNDELIPILWERVRRLMYMQSGKVYERRKLYFDKAGVELWDIKQTCYEAFLKAIGGYKPEQNNKFTAYLNYPFKTAVRDLLGIRTGNRNPLNDSISLDEPLDETGETFLSDTIEDPKAAAEFDQVENDDICSIVRNVVSQLEFEQRHVIQEKYFNDRSLSDIAAQLNISRDQVRRIELAALKELRRSSVLQSLYKEEQIHNQLQILSRFRNTPQYFYLLDEVLKLQAQGVMSYGKAQAALYMAEMKYNNMRAVTQ